jgi:hypothetical protein
MFRRIVVILILVVVFWGCKDTFMDDPNWGVFYRGTPIEVEYLQGSFFKVSKTIITSENGRKEIVWGHHALVLRRCNVIEFANGRHNKSRHSFCD